MLLDDRCLVLLTRCRCNCHSVPKGSPCRSRVSSCLWHCQSCESWGSVLCPPSCLVQ